MSENERLRQANNTLLEQRNAMESVLGKIGDFLGIEPGDVDGLLAKIEANSVEIEQKTKLIEQAALAIESLPEDALGYGRADNGRGTIAEWPLRDELLAALQNVLPTKDSGQ